VLAAAYTPDEDQLQISRRIELQAWRTTVPDEIHGKSASQPYWVNRGFGTDDFGRCSTRTATNHIS
jgi:hypothetical protein